MSRPIRAQLWSLNWVFYLITAPQPACFLLRTCAGLLFSSCCEQATFLSCVFDCLAPHCVQVISHFPAFPTSLGPWRLFLPPRMARAHDPVTCTRRQLPLPAFSVLTGGVSRREVRGPGTHVSRQPTCPDLAANSSQFNMQYVPGF